MAEEVKRRIKGDGSVYQRKDLRWVAAYGGKTKYAKTEREAKQKLNELKRAPSTLLKTAPAKVSTQEYFEAWLSTYKKASLKQSSYDRLETVVRKQINPTIGGITIQQVTPEDCQNLLNDLIDSGSSYSVVKKTYDALQACFKHATIKDNINKNPMLVVGLPSSSTFENKTDTRALSREEERNLLIELSNTWTSSGKPMYNYKNAFILLLNTGMRAGELVALDWEDVDFEKCIVHVHKNVVVVKERGKDGEATGGVRQVVQNTPKTKTSNRNIPLNDNAIKALKELKNMYPDSSSVLTTSTGNRTFITALNKQLSKAYKKCGISNAGVHTLRHTFATRLFEKKVDVKTVSSLLGHSSTAITYNLYIHVIEEDKREVVQLLNSI